MSELLQHDFGFGKIPASRHSNGGGWVANTATVEETCYVGPYAEVFGNATVSGNAFIDGNAKVYDYVTVTGNAKIYGNADISEYSCVTDNAKVCGNAKVYGHALIMNNATIHSNAIVFGDSKVGGFAEVGDNSKVYGNADLNDFMKIYGNCVVTRRPITILGFRRSFVITDHHVCVNDAVIPPIGVKKFCVRLMTAMGYKLEDSRRWKQLLLTAIELHGCTDRDRDLVNNEILEALVRMKVEKDAGLTDDSKR